MPAGCIVVVGLLIAVHSTNQDQGAAFWRSVLAEREFGDYSPDRYAWELADMVALKEPIPCRGMQGLWTPSSEVVQEIKSQVTFNV